MSEQTPAELSEREREILRLVATGASNKQIAQQLVISANTVKVHLRNIFTKIGAASRTEAAMYAVRLGLVRDTTLAEPITPEENSLPPTPPDSAAAVEEAPPPSESEPPAPPRWTAVWRWLPWAGVVGALALVVIIVLTLNSRAAAPTRQPDLIPTPTPQPRWQALADMPTARFGLAAALYDGKIYAIGGETTGGVTGAVEGYDPATDTWQTMTAKPIPVADVHAAAIGGRIYIPGGRLADGQITAALEIYDPRENTWARGADLPRATSAYALAAFEGQLYIFGGWDGSEYLAAVYQYDPQENQWTERSPMPTPRAFAGATVVEGRVFVMGGRNSSGALSVNETYQPILDAGEGIPWNRVVDIPVARSGLSVASVAGFIHVIGGQGDSMDKLFSLEYLPASNTWNTFDNPINQEISYLALIPSGSYLYVLGGKGNDQVLAQNWIYQAIYTIAIPIVR